MEKWSKNKIVIKNHYVLYKRQSVHKNGCDGCEQMFGIAPMEVV